MMNNVKAGLTYFGASATFIFGGITLIKFIKEDELYINLLIGVGVGLVALIGALFVKKDY